MWVHSDLVEGEQWTTVTNRKSKGKVKASPCNVVCASSQEAKTDIPYLTDSEEETSVLRRAECATRGRNSFGTVILKEIR